MSQGNDLPDKSEPASLNEERLDSEKKNREYREAQDKNADSFKSFSEGMATVDKFMITGLEGEETETDLKSDSFQSFSDGLDAVDKFEITARDRDSENAQKDEITLEIGLIQYLSRWSPESGNLLGCTKTLENSRTISELVERLYRLAWKDEITICLHKTEYPCEYDPLRHRIHLDLTRNEEEQLVDLTHQLYHSVHRYLDKLYGDGPVSLETFTDTFLWAEAGALLAELNVRMELGLKNTAETGFKLPVKDGESTALKDAFIEPILKVGGAKALRDKLERSIKRDDFQNKNLYCKSLETHHRLYLDDFEKMKATAQSLITESIKAGLPPGKI